MLALLKSPYTRRTLMCMSAAALLWSGSPAESAQAARYYQIPELSSGSPAPAPADSKETAAADRKQLFEQMGAATGIPWYRFAAIDQYERSIARKSKKTAAAENPSAAAKPRLTGIIIPAPVWSGPLNPDQDDKQPDSIRFFGGFGLDGSGTASPIPRAMPTCSTAWPATC